MRKAYALFLGACLAWATASSWAQGQGRETIRWYVSSFPPYTITAGRDEGQGITDMALKAITKRLTGFDHDIVIGSHTRMMEMMKSRSDACSASLLRTKEREADMDFSVPAMEVMPNAVITTRSRLAGFKPFLNERGELKFGELLAAGQLRLGLSADRSFGPTLDPMLKKHASSVVVIPASDGFSSRLLKLSNQNEFDAILGYAIELKYTAREFRLQERDFVVMPIAESSSLLTIAVACSKSPTGKRVLQAVDQFLLEPAFQRELDGYYRSWLDDNMAAHYDRMLVQLRESRASR